MIFNKNLFRLITTQLHFLASQRVQRTSKIYSIYERIYGEIKMRTMMFNTIKQMRNRFKLYFTRNRTLMLLSSAMYSYNWTDNGISNEEIFRTVNDHNGLFAHLKNQSNSNDSSCKNDTCSESCDEQNKKDVPLYGLQENGWESVIVKENYQVWRKAINSTGLYEYKVFGTFNDIPARIFFIAQYDIEYRKQWDNLIIKLDIVEKEIKHNASIENLDSGNEVIRWVMHYPFPMYGREYCFVRRAFIDIKKNTMIFIARAVEHPKCPPSNGYVRVDEYSSKLIVKPHSTFDENGFDYVLSYYDDPKSSFPSPAYNWMACSGVPNFVEKLHQAALQLYLNKSKYLMHCKIANQNSNQQTQSSVNANREYVFA